MTVEELRDLKDNGNRHELIRGELITKPWESEEPGNAAFMLGVHVGRYLRDQDPDVELVTNSSFILARNPDVVLIPHAAFIRSERLAGIEKPEGLTDFVPDLVVEIVLSEDLCDEMTARLLEYLDAGVQIVWFLDPSLDVITVYTSDRTGRILRRDDELDGGPVMPDFRVPLGEIFG